MAELKTKRTSRSVTAFIDAIRDPERRRDCRSVLRIMKDVTKAQPKMWGTSIVGFGSYHYRYASGREGDWFRTGFSPRKQDLTLYLMAGFAGRDALMRTLGRYKTGKACLYIKRLEDVDLAVLTRLIRQSVKHTARSNA
ncbi:MAG: DUF1801 domain-containing protein [Gemmatimonadales bacterium]